MTLRAALICLSLAMPARALAATGLEWQWGDDEPVFFLQAVVRPHEVMWFKAERNREVRIAEFRIDILTRCRAVEERGKKAWAIECTLHDVGLQAAAVSADAGQLAAVLDEYDQRLTGAVVHLDLTRDGRIREIDLEGVEKRDERTKEQHEAMRLILARAFAILDMQLPRKGDDKGRGQWKQGQNLAMGFPSDKGTMGSASVVHQIDAVDGSVVQIRSQGSGTLGSGEVIIVAGTERPKDLFEMELDGLARFDVQRGLLLERGYHVKGTPHASSHSTDFGAGYVYEQAARLVHVPAGEEPPELAPTGPLDSGPAPAPTPE